MWYLYICTYAPFYFLFFLYKEKVKNKKCIDKYNYK